MQELQFECQAGCTCCCQVNGYVYITEGDLKRMAAFLGMPARTFEEKYVYRTRHLLRLRKPRGSQCHFLSGRGCAVHSVKPTQCRAYPLWPELVESREAWKEASITCPGIGKGPFIPFEGALRAANEMREAYGTMYDS